MQTLYAELRQERRLVERLRRLAGCPPLLVKIAPDLEDESIDEIARLAFEEGLAGVIAVNTSLDRLGLERRRLVHRPGVLLVPGGVLHRLRKLHGHRQVPVPVELRLPKGLQAGDPHE